MLRLIKNRMWQLASIALVVLILAQMVLPQPVYALTQTRVVEAEGDQTDGGYFLGGVSGGNFANLNSDDGEASYLRNGGNAFHCYNFQDFTTASNPINSVTLYYKMRLRTDCGEVSTVKPYCRIGGTNYYGDVHGVVTDSYVLFSWIWADNPATGVAWVQDDLDDTGDADKAQFGINLIANPCQSHTTYMYLVIDYDLPTVPSVSTGSADNISYSGGIAWADFHGAITDTGGPSVTCRGFAWGTTSNATTPGSSETPSASYTDNWSQYSADWGVGAFARTVNLATCTIYYYRVYAQNSVGWAWGSEQGFTTMCDPTIDTREISHIGSTTVRLNSLVVNDGEQACDVRFCYGTSSGNCTVGALGCPGLACNCTTYDTTTAWVNNAYTAGQTPYIDLTGLSTATTYYYCAQIRNDVSCRCGGERSFKTETGISYPTDFRAIPRSRDVSLSWVKGEGTTDTLINYKLGDYPVWTITGASGVHFTGGVGSYIDCGVIHNAEAQMWQGFWFMLDEDWVGGPWPIVTQMLWEKNDGLGNKIEIHLFTDGKLYFRKEVAGPGMVFNIVAKDAGAADIVSWNAGQWYHVYAAISNGAGHNEARLHVRTIGDAGTLVTDPDITPAPNGGNFLVGSKGFEGILADFYCGIADIAVADEVNLYGAGLPYTGTPPVAYHDYWALDEGTGTLAEDTGTTPGEDGTLASACTWYGVTGFFDGILVYFDSASSTIHTGLTPGTTYYYIARGESGGFYSDSSAYAMATTLAAGPVIPTPPVPPTPVEWSAAPSVAGIVDIPFYALVNFFADSYSLPRETMWYGLAIMFSVGLGLFVYWRGNKNLLASIIGVLVGLCIGAVLGLVYLWVGVFFCLMAITMGWMAQRY